MKKKEHKYKLSPLLGGEIFFLKNSYSKKYKKLAKKYKELVDTPQICCGKEKFYDKIMAKAE